MLVDSGCSVTLMTAMRAGNRSRSSKQSGLCLVTMNGQTMMTQGYVSLLSLVSNGVELGPITAHIVAELPLGVDLVLGLPVMQRVGCWIGQDTNGCLDVRWGPLGSCKLVGSINQRADPKLVIDDDDFQAHFQNGVWNAKWKWRENCELPIGCHRQYRIREETQAEFDEEVRNWISEGILVEWRESIHGAVRHHIPLMAVMQQKGDSKKVRPVLDYRQLNEAIESRTGGAMPICRDRVREWRQQGKNCSIVDLRKAYLQVHVDSSLWPFQAVQWNGKTYLLTRLGFGLSIAPKVMTAIVTKVLGQSELVKAGASSYIDDIFVNDNIVRSEIVVEQLRKYGLLSKEPISLGTIDGVRVLGLRVDQKLQWKRDSLLPRLESQCLSRRDVHRVIGEWLGHNPVSGWLRVWCAFIQRCTARDNTDWNEKVSDDVMQKVRDVEKRLHESGDPAHGNWLVDPKGKVTVWTDASNLALGVALEVDGSIVEDASWLRDKQDTAHINLAELDAVLRGINLTVKWGFREFSLATDSATVYGWLRSVVDRTHNVKTNALSELLIRRRLDTLREIISQEKLKIMVKQVSTTDNLSDELTRVPKRWLLHPHSVTQKVAVVGHTSEQSTPSFAKLQELHAQHHFGIDRTLELAREAFGGEISRRIIKKVVSRCDACARIDPASTKFEHGKLTVEETWFRLAIDISYVNGKPWLSVVDCGSGFNTWFKLRDESAIEIRDCLLKLFTSLGPPHHLLSDNGTVFRSQLITQFLKEWAVQLILSSAYRSKGNGVVERSHRTIKRMAARTGKSVEMCTFWYNVTHGHRSCSPYESLFAVKPRIPGVRATRTEISRVPSSTHQEMPDRRVESNPFELGDEVYLKPVNAKCDQLWTGPHRVTAVKSNVTVEIGEDGITRHISYLRKVPLRYRSDSFTSGNSSESSSESEVEAGESYEAQPANSELPLRRSTRIRNKKQHCVGCE